LILLLDVRAISQTTKEKQMALEAKAMAVQKRWELSLDSWAVLAAFLLALLVRVGIFKHIPW
jgi:hypothetical protein